MISRSTGTRLVAQMREHRMKITDEDSLDWESSILPFSIQGCIRFAHNVFFDDTRWTGGCGS